MNLSERIENATWEEMHGSLLEETIRVLDSVHRRTTVSEAFHRAIPYIISLKVSPSSAITLSTTAPLSTSVSTPINAPPPSATPNATVVPLTNFSSATAVTSTANVVPPSVNHSQSLRASRPTSSITQATSLKLQQPEPTEHQDVRNFLKRVQNQTVQFWNPNIQQHITSDDARLVHTSVNYGVFLCLTLEDTEIHHKILHRFARVVVYELSLHGYTAQSLAQAFQEVSVSKSKGNLRERIEGYISAGSRYVHLANKLGGYAALFFLPQGIGSSFWERKTPKTGPVHDDVVRKLKEAGIPTIAQPFQHLAATLVRPSKDLISSQSLRSSINVGISDVILTPACEARKRHQEITHGHERQKMTRLSAAESSSPMIQHNRFRDELREESLSMNASSEESDLESRTNVLQASYFTNPISPDLPQSVKTTLHQSNNLERDIGTAETPETQPSPASEGNHVFGRDGEINHRVINAPQNVMQNTDSISSGSLGTHTLHPVTRPPLGPNYQGRAGVARLDKLEKILGEPLLNYMNTSLLRHLEDGRKDNGPIRVTSAVAIYFGAQRCNDFMMEVLLGSSIGQSIAQNLVDQRSVEYLKALLGEYLFEGMMDSIHRKEEEKRGVLASTTAVKMIVPSGSDDCKLQVMVGYERGRDIWYAAF